MNCMLKRRSEQHVTLESVFANIIGFKTFGCNYTNGSTNTRSLTFTADNEGQYWYLFYVSDGSRFGVYRIDVSSSAITVTNLQKKSRGSASLQGNPTVSGFTLTSTYMSFGGLIALRFGTTYPRTILDNLLANAPIEWVYSYSDSSAKLTKEYLAVESYKIPRYGVLFNAFCTGTSSVVWCFSQANSPLTLIRGANGSTWYTDSTDLYYDSEADTYYQTTSGTGAATYTTGGTMYLCFYG